MISDFFTFTKIMGTRWRLSYIILIGVTVFVALIDTTSIIIFALASTNSEFKFITAEFSAELAAITFIFSAAMIRGLLQYLQIKFSFLSAVILGKKIVNLYLESKRTTNNTISDNRILSSITVRLSAISGNIILPVLQLINFFFFIIFLILGLMYFQNFTMLLALASLVTVFASIYIIIKPFTRNLGVKINLAYTLIVEKLNETTQIWNLIKLRMQEGSVADSYAALETSYRRNMANVGFLTSLPRFGVEILLALSLGFVLLINNSLGSLNLVDILVFGYAALRTIPMVQQGYNSITFLTSGYAVLKELIELISEFEKYQSKNKSDKTNLDALNSIEAYSVSSERILGSKKKPIFFKIKRNEKIAITGDSGSGKSTLLDIITGLESIDDEKVFYNGQCINSINLKSVYKQIAYLPQVAPLVNGTVRENMLFGIESDFSNRLFCDLLILMGFVNRTGEIDQKFLERQVGDRGKNLSGGQRQRIQLVNTLIADKKILILDEATSALDTDLEDSIIDYVLNRDDLTVVLITHNTRIKKKFNKTIELNQ